MAFPTTNPFRTDTTGSTAGTVASAPVPKDTSGATAGVVADGNIPEIEDFKDNVDVGSVAYATPPSGVGSRLDIGGASDTSGSTAGTVASSSSGGSSGCSVV